MYFIARFFTGVDCIAETDHVICRDQIFSISPMDRNKFLRNPFKSFMFIGECKRELQFSIRYRHTAIISVV